MTGISLDGFFEGPDRDISWHKVDEELHRHMNEFIGGSGGFLQGRVTHEGMSAAWATADDDYTPAMKEFAGIWRDKPKIVYSRTLEHDDWATQIVREVVPAEVRALKEQPGEDLLLGGADLGATFLRQGLVDELRIYVHPAVIGRGRSPFPPDTRLDLDLVESHTFGNGVVLLRYDVGSSAP